MVRRGADADSGAPLRPRRPVVPAADPDRVVFDRARRVRRLVVQARSAPKHPAPIQAMAAPRGPVSDADAVPSADQRAAGRRRSGDALRRDLLRRLLGAHLRGAPATARPHPRHHAGLQRDQLPRRRPAGLRPGSVDAARAVVRLHHQPGGDGDRDLHRTGRPAHRAAAGAVRYAGRGVRRRDGGRAARPRVRARAFCVVETARRARVRPRRDLRDLPEPRPGEPGGDGRDDGGLCRHLDHARRAQAPDRLRRAWRRAGRGRLDGLGRAGRLVHPGAVLHAARGRSRIDLLQLPRPAARRRLRRTGRRVSLRRRAGAVGHDARLFRRPVEPRFDGALGRGPAERVDAGRRHLPPRPRIRRRSSPRRCSSGG